MEVFMCDVALHAMSGRALATLVRAEVVMVETPVTESSIQAGGRTAHPGHARPSRVQEHRGKGDGGQQQQHLVRYDLGLYRCQEV